MLKCGTNAAIHLRYNELPIKVISRKHLKQVLSHIDIYYGENAYRYKLLIIGFYSLVSEGQPKIPA